MDSYKASKMGVDSRTLSCNISLAFIQKKNDARPLLNFYFQLKRSQTKNLLDKYLRFNTTFH